MVRVGVRVRFRPHLWRRSPCPCLPPDIPTPGHGGPGVSVRVERTVIGLMGQGLEATHHIKLVPADVGLG